MFLLPSEFENTVLRFFFLKCVKRSRRRRLRKYEEHKTNFEGAYLHGSWVDLTETWNGLCPSPRDFPLQKWCSSDEGLLRYRVQMLVPVWNTLVYCVPALAVLGHTTHCRVGLGNISINRQYHLIKYPQYNYCMHLAFAILLPRQYLSHLAIIIALII